LIRAAQPLPGRRSGIPRQGFPFCANVNLFAPVALPARDFHADLIVLGGRERHGVSILVNFTEDTVLHAAPCDVLAVRVK